MGIINFFNNWFFNDFDEVVSWIVCGGAAWTLVVFVFNLSFSIIYDFIRGGKR